MEGFDGIKDWATMKRSVEVEIVQAGQPRPYADRIYEGFLTFSVPEGQGWASKYPGDSAEIVKPYVKLMLASFAENPEWHQPRLDKLERLPDGRWHAIVTSPYLD